MNDTRNDIAKIKFDEKYQELYGSDCDEDREYSYEDEDFRSEYRDRIHKVRRALGMD